MYVINCEFSQDEPLTADEIQEVQLALNQMNMEFKTELKEAKHNKKTPEECQRLIDEHKAGMEEMQSLLEKEKDRMQAALMAKLEARKNKQKVRPILTLSLAAWYQTTAVL